MKKILCMALAVCLLCVTCVFFSACTPRSEKLIIQNWGDYMPEEVYMGFESWYKEKTGKKVKVVYGTYEINEEMYRKLNGGSDYDLVCPSDYMIERMINEGKLQKLSQKTLDVLKGTDTSEGKIDPAILEFAKVYDSKLEYSMPYLWGTMGIMYNKEASNQNDGVMSSWAALWDESIGKTDKVFMKDSPKDSYTIAMLYNYREDLLKYGSGGSEENAVEYDKIMNGIFGSATAETLELAKSLLKAQKDKNLIKDYDVDLAKIDMQNDANGRDGFYGAFWSCDAGYIMNSEDGSNFNLRYIVPEEGSNVWIDGFVIPKNAVNTEAANMFIQYLCETDIAYDCMDFAGCTSAVIEAAEEYKADLEEDSKFFANKPAGFREMYMDMLFPSDEILSRCRLMKDFGTLNDQLVDMWEDVRAYKPR